MKVAPGIYLIASGSAGALYTHPNDCNAYALDCGGEYVLVDSGAGVEPERILEILAADGIPGSRIRHLLLTHYHLDHAGGARWMRDRFGLGVWASAETARALETGDEEAISLAAAKRAGVYPAELAFHSCPVERKLADGEEWAFGEAQFQALHTPGHSRDMLSYLVRAGGRLLLFPGDTVFHGGKVLISDTHDCDVHAYAQSLRRLAEHPIDALFPGHMLWVARGARSHTAAALEYVRRLLLPPNVL